MDNGQFMQSWHPATLPSMGYLYTTSPEQATEMAKVELLPWSTAAEEVFVRYGGDKPEQLIDKLLLNNVRLAAGLKYENLLSTDKFFLLVYLRCISLVPHYTVPHACPKCKHEHPVQLNLLTDLKVKTPDEMQQEPFEVKLPRSGAVIQFRMMRVHDERAIADYEAKVFEVKGTREQGSPGHRFRIARGIVRVNGQELPHNQKLDFVQQMSMLDSQVLKQAREKHETGFIMDFPITCPLQNCGHVHRDWEVPMHHTFFHPLESDISPEAGVAVDDRGGDALPS